MIKKNKLGILILFSYAIVVFLIPNTSAASQILYEDDESFWTAVSGGTGTIDISIGEETTIVVSGDSSLRYQLISGSYSYINVQHVFSTAQDWSGYDYLSFYWYGTNGGSPIRISLESPNYSNRYSITFTDSFLGWQRVVLAFSDFTSTGSPSLSNVAKISINYSGSASPRTWYVDQLMVETETHELVTRVEGEGSVIRDPPASSYEHGTTVELTADPEPGWSFVGWGGDLSGNTNPSNIVIDDDKSVTAVFTSTATPTLSTDKTQYQRGEVVTVRIRSGTKGEAVMIQFSKGGASVWADQVDVDSAGDLDYKIKIPSDWATGTYLIEIKDVLSGSHTSTAFTVYVPAPPSGGGPSGGGPSGGGPSIMLPTSDEILSSTPEEAAKMLEDFSAEAVAKKLTTLDNKTHVAYILGYFDPEYARDVLTEMDEDLAASLLHTMTEDTAVPVLLEMDQTDSKLLKAFMEFDFNSSVALVEEAVKTKVEGLNETERKKQLELFSAALASLDVDTLVETLIAISKLPETPTIAAYIINSMSLETVLNVASLWINDYSEELPVLGTVMESLDTETLNYVYRGITDQERETILPYLSAATISRVSATTTFQATDLNVSPSVIEPGGSVTISYVITNTGDSADSYVVSMKIDDIVEEIDEGFLYADESVTIQHIVQRTSEKTYIVTVNGASSSFEVVEPTPPPEPADLRLAGVEVAPSMVYRGDDVTIYATVTNLGEETGSETFTLMLSGSELESKEASNLLGGSEITLIFKVTMDYEPGAYEFTIDGESVTVEVQQQEAKFPWVTGITTIVILVAIVVYMYYQRTQSIEP